MAAMCHVYDSAVSQAAARVTRGNYAATDEARGNAPGQATDEVRHKASAVRAKGYHVTGGVAGYG